MIFRSHAAGLEGGQHIVAGDIGRIMAGHKVRRVDKIGGLNGLLAEAQVADGAAAGYQ